MGEAEFEEIAGILREAGAEFKEFEHEPVRTSAQAAAVRGTSLKEGVKALVIRFKRPVNIGKLFFVVAAVPADKLLDWKKAKAVLQASEIGFASEQEVIEETGCEPGGVPPLCHANKLAVLVDPKVFEQEFLEFNAGLTTKSIRVSSAGLRKAFDLVGAAYFDLVK